MLVIDRDARTSRDHRLVAHLAADEPAENAALVCAMYVRQAQAGTVRCRALRADDFSTPPLSEDDALTSPATGEPPVSQLLDGLGNAYCLRPIEGEMSIPELRWCLVAQGECSITHTVSVRRVIAALESYEPVRALTRRALLEARAAPISTSLLGAELVRVLESPIVLNRGLREAALAAIRHRGLTLSEIAIRCGRSKRDAAGNVTGETSWLARRLGMAPEGGKDAPTPWVHSDVLALIARRGLLLSPREVELG